MLSGCQRVTVEDAEKTANAETGIIARNLSEYHKQKEQADKDKKDSNSDNTLNTNLDEESNKKVIVANIGETVSVTTMECQVSDVLFAKNIYELYAITDETSADSVITDMFRMYGSDSNLAKMNGKVYLQDNGDAGASFNQFIFVKIKIHYTGKTSKEICMCPNIYNGNENLEYQYMSTISAEVIDKKQQDGADRMFYVFEPEQEEEFIIAFSVKNDITGCDLYLDTTFIKTDHYSSDPTNISDGTKFIKLSLGE